MSLPTDRRAASAEALTLHLDQLHADVNDMKEILRELTAAVVRLAVVEERQTQTTTMLAQTAQALSDLEKRVTQVEKQDITNKRISGWVDKGIWGAVIVVVGFVLKKVGLL
jgi:RNA processing factor Prp31